MNRMDVFLWISFPASWENSTFYMHLRGGRSHMSNVYTCTIVWGRAKLVKGRGSDTELQYLQCAVFLCRCGSVSLPFDFSVLCSGQLSYIGDEHVRTSGEGNEPDTFGTDTVYVWLWLQVVRQNTAHKSTQRVDLSGAQALHRCSVAREVNIAIWFMLMCLFWSGAAIFRYDSRRFPWRLLFNAAGFSNIVFMTFGLHMFLANLHWTFSLVLLLAPHLCNLLNNCTYLYS